MASEYRVVFAAARSLPVDAIAEHVIRELVSLPMDATVLLRRARYGQENEFEYKVAVLCADLKIPVEWFGPMESGREGTFKRDVEMVRSANKVVGYFDGESVMEGGTGHVLERAIADEIPCAAWVWDRPEEALDWLGGD